MLSGAANFAPWVRAYFTDDDIPWCALFVNECLRVAGVVGTKDVLAAGSFRAWGNGCGPTLGAIACFKRPGGNHVGFYLGQRLDGTIRVRGGNQSNRVSDTWIAADRLTGYRWPSSLPIPAPAPIILYADGSAVSSNEA